MKWDISKRPSLRTLFQSCLIRVSGSQSLQREKNWMNKLAMHYVSHKEKKERIDKYDYCTSNVLKKKKKDY